MGQDALRTALEAIHPLPWVVYEKRGSNWIKDADHQWVGFTYNLATAHLIVQAMNALASDAGSVGALDVYHTPETPDFDIDVIEGRLVGVWKGTDDRVPFQWQMDMASLIDHYRKAIAMLAHVLDRTHDSGCDTCDAARAAADAERQGEQPT